MKAVFLAAFYFVITFNCIQAQNGLGNFGARSNGIGNSSVSLTDEWSLFNNVGGISGVESGVAFFGYDHYVQIEGFDRIAAGLIQPFRFGNLGISFYKFGDDLFSEQTASAAYGNKIGFVRLGAKINYYQIRIDEFGTANALYFDLGGIVELLPKLSFGAFISNFTLSKLNSSEQSELPVIMKIGLSYMPKDQLKINLDLHKDVKYEPMIKAGIEYLIADKFYLRTGVNSNPFKGFFGLGILLNRFKIDYSFSNHDFLGSSHQASVSFNYQKKNEK